MKLLDLKNTYKISEWAYWECKKGNGSEDIKKLITEPYWAFRYCEEIKDEPILWAFINDSYAYEYCKKLWDNDKIWQNITDSYWACQYCINIKNREELLKYIIRYVDMFYYFENFGYQEIFVNKIKTSIDAAHFCHKIKNDLRLHKLIKRTSKASCYYCMNVEDDPEIRKYISSPRDSADYCINIKDDPKIRKQITSSEACYRYCIFKNDNAKMAKIICKSKSYRKKYIEWKNKKFVKEINYIFSFKNGNKIEI